MKNLGIIAMIVALAAIFSFTFDFMGVNAQQSKVSVSDSGSRKSRPAPSPRTAYWTGNGANYDGESFEFSSSRCEESEGQPYIYWVLTAGGRDSLDNAQISINGSNLVAMSRVSKGSFKYTQTFDGDFVVPTNVYATYQTAKSANLVISHGCTGEVAAGPSFTLSFDETDEGLANATYNPCPQEPFPFSGYTGETIEVCDFGGSVNLYLGLPIDYTVTSSPEANCTSDGGFDLTGGKLEGTAGGPQLVYWSCSVISPNTVITITAPSGPEQPVCDANPTELEYKLVLNGVSGTYGSETFTGATLTLTAVGNVADITSGSDPFPNYGIPLASPKTKITISGTTLNNSTVDVGMKIFTAFEDSTAFLIWQDFGYGWDLVTAQVWGSSVPAMSSRLSTCWADSWTSDGSNSAILYQAQWNDDPIFGNIPRRPVSVGGVPIFMNDNGPLSGSMRVGPVPVIP